MPAALQGVDCLAHMHRDTDGPALVGKGSRQRLPNPPGRVSGKLEAALVLELVDRPHKADIAFLDEAKEAKSAVGETLGLAHHQPQVGFRQLLLRAPAL